MSAAHSPVIPVFVYGALRPGSANPHAPFLTSRCRVLGRARLNGRLFRLGSQFAAVHEPHSTTVVIGDILLLPQEGAEPILISLDRYEGIGIAPAGTGSYRRERVPVVLESGETMECWTWLYCREVHELLPVHHGDALAMR